MILIQLTYNRSCCYISTRPNPCVVEVVGDASADEALARRERRRGTVKRAEASVLKVGSGANLFRRRSQDLN